MALRNLALDHKNRDLIGQYAMNDLVAKLPPPDRPRSTTTSDLTLCGVLGVLYEILRTNSQFTKKFCEDGGVDKLMAIVKSPSQVSNIPNFVILLIVSITFQYSQRVVRYAAHLLHIMWQQRDVHSLLKQNGKYSDQDYLLPMRQFCHATTGSTTLGRPMSTQGAERPAGAASRLRPDLHGECVRG